MQFGGAHRADGPEQPGVLVAEDDENDICLIRRAFQKAQFEHPVSVVKDGEEALAYLQGLEPYTDRQCHPPPALVLLDLKMPRKNGFEVLEWIRDQPEFNHLPVVVLTSSQEGADISRAYALGANSYLVKPANFASLVEMMNRLRQFCSFTRQNVGVNWI
ncbi:MAG: response regulator [Verrucomicrobiales bacterium]|nr:response regulator [Verrucomicrobiales bacterium]